MAASRDKVPKWISRLRWSHFVGQFGSAVKVYAVV